MYLLFAALIALGPLVRRHRPAATHNPSPAPASFGLADLPG
jgi:hypothetical protein